MNFISKYLTNYLLIKLNFLGTANNNLDQSIV